MRRNSTCAEPDANASDFHTVFGCRTRWNASLPAGSVGLRRPAGFTLIELILVMTMLVILLALVAPSLSRFFRGRTLDLEAKRFLAVTRYAQSRAISEALPVLVWLDQEQQRYGLEADSSYVDRDAKAVEYQCDDAVRFEVEQSAASHKAGSVWKGNGRMGRNMPKIRFIPDGSISESSPEMVVFRGREKDGEIFIGEDLTRSKYEIQTNQTQRLLP
jgi:type II secretion system protein H